jgi:hypothetical protein
MDIETVRLPRGTWPSQKVTESEEDYLTRISTSALTAKIVCIGLAEGEGEVQALIGDEGAMLELWWKVLQGPRGIMPRWKFVGHNILDFDLRFIVQRSILLGIRPTYTIPFFRFKDDPVYDTMQEWTKWRGGVKLRDLAIAMGFPDPKGDIAGKDVHDAFERGEIARISDYCRGDVETVRKVYKRMKFLS